MKKSLLATGLILISSIHVGAMEIDISADINIKTVYRNCTKYADRICEYCVRINESKNDSEKSYFYEKVNKNKKKLNKCEKNNKNEIKNKKLSIDGGKFQFGFSF